MEPNNKLEQNFRDQLSQREIQPSEKAWDRLDAMLSVAEKKKPKRTWMYIAASFLGFLLVGTIFFNQSKTEHIDSQKGIVLENKKENMPQEIKETPFIVEEAVIASNENHQLKESHQTQKTSIKKEQINRQVLEASLSQEVAIQDAKAQEVAQKIMEISKSGKEVTDEEINDLLNKAKKDIASQRLFNKTTKKVDATALLLDAERGLDNSFKQKVFDLLKDGYRETKIFVAERNN